jgi:hypothetical protein
MTESLSGPTHGKPGTYRRGCRCDECRAANTRYAREERKKRRERLETAQFKHGAAAYTNWGCRCEVCTKAHTKLCAPAGERWRKRDPEAVLELKRRWRERNPETVLWVDRTAKARRQAETLEKAGRHYYRWTGDELELADRDDLTIKEIALMIGRSYAAVKNMRQKLKDPGSPSVLPADLESL